MACKGLVELIVLNVGLQAEILDTRLFSMFVVHALVLTFITTPLTLLWYPPKHRTLLDVSKKAITGVDAVSYIPGQSAVESSVKSSFAVVLNKAEHLPAVLTLTQLLYAPAPAPRVKESITSVTASRLTFSALRLLELSERTSAILKSQEATSLARTDPLLSVFRTFGRLNRVPVSTSLAIVNPDEFAGQVTSFVRERGAHMVVVPWTLPGSSGTREVSTSSPSTLTISPFDSFFPSRSEKATAPSAASQDFFHSTFIRNVFSGSSVDVAVFIDRSDSDASEVENSGGQHLFLPFFGGPDDRLALELVVQICANQGIDATVVRIRRVEEGQPDALVRADTIEQEKAISMANFTLSVCFRVHLLSSTWPF